jgi:hypothetical protein
VTGLDKSIKAFSNGRRIPVVRVPANAAAADVANALGLPLARALLLLIGGSGLMPQGTMEQLKTFFDTLAQTIAVGKVTVVDGGTHAGVVELMGAALDRQRTAAYVGVVPARAEVEPGGPRAEEILEPHHSHFVLVDSDKWGAEIPLMQALAKYLAPRGPSVALLVNGGEVAQRELEAATQNGYEVMVLAGSGRLADEIAEACRRPQQPVRTSLDALLKGARLTLLDVSAARVAVRELLETKLSLNDRSEPWEQA